MATTVFLETHTEEMQEIISRPPHWIIRWGITSSLILVILLIAGCWFIQYPDVVSTSFTLTSVEAPRILISRADGKLEKLLVKDGQQVASGQLLAYRESTADHIQILHLSEDIDRFSKSIQNNEWNKINSLNLVDHQRLGEVQQDFQVFAQKLVELKTFLRDGFYEDKRKLINQDIHDLKELELNLVEQLNLQKEDFSLGEEEFMIQEKLHVNKVIATIEYKREKAKLLAREMPIKTIMSALIQNRSYQTAKQKEILEIDNSIAEHKYGFQQALLTLQSSIQTWKQQYCFTAPISGKVSFTIPWQEQQHISSGQELLTVEPVKSNYQGLLKISQINIGKIKVGQTVLIKLEGYPYREYGMLDGNLTKFSATPGIDSVYWGHVSLPDQLKTRYGRTIPYRNGLQGTGEIVTANRRLIGRLLSGFRNGGI